MRDPGCRDHRAPTSLCLAREQMRRGAGPTVLDATRTGYPAGDGTDAGHDVTEGVRAVLVDKDDRPAWVPATLEAGDPAAIRAAFEPAEGPEPGLA